MSDVEMKRPHVLLSVVGEMTIDISDPLRRVRLVVNGRIEHELTCAELIALIEGTRTVQP